MEKMNSVIASVKGKRRFVYLLKQLAPNKWHAKIYVNHNGKGKQTSVRGTYQVYANGARRFTPTGKNADLI